jgi:hypothetical protein
MALQTRNSALSLDNYIKVLHQLHNATLHPLSPQSVLSVLLRSQGRSDDFRPHLAAAERIAEFLTAEQRRAPGRTAWPERELLAAATGTPLREIDRLIQNFDEVTEVSSQYLHLGLWGRIKRLTREDPLLAWLRKRLRLSRATAIRSDDRG